MSIDVLSSSHVEFKSRHPLCDVNVTIDGDVVTVVGVVTSVVRLDIGVFVVVTSIKGCIVLMFDVHDSSSVPSVQSSTVSHRHNVGIHAPVPH